MRALGVVELQRVGNGVECAFGGAAEVPAQPRHATVAAVGAQPGLLRLQPGAAGQELAHLVAVVHGLAAATGADTAGGTGSTWNNRLCLIGPRWAFLDVAALPQTASG